MHDLLAMPAELWWYTLLLQMFSKGKSESSSESTELQSFRSDYR